MTDERTAILNGYRVTPGYLARFMESQQAPAYRIAGEDYPRVRYGSERDEEMDSSRPCHDCRAIEGQYHAIGCDMEECPRCFCQAIMCDCEDDDDDDDDDGDGQRDGP